MQESQCIIHHHLSRSTCRAIKAAFHRRLRSFVCLSHPFLAFFSFWRSLRCSVMPESSHAGSQCWATLSSSWLPSRALGVSSSPTHNTIPLPSSSRLLPIVLCSPSVSLFVIVLSARLHFGTNAGKRSDAPPCRFALFAARRGTSRGPRPMGFPGLALACSPCRQVP